MQEINVLYYLIALCLGSGGALVVGAFGKQLQLIDKPNKRSSHDKTTPKGGGIGILAAFLVFSILFDVGLYFWGPAVLLAFISLLGDRFDIGAVPRLLAQFVLASCFLFFVFIYHPCCLSIPLGILMFVFYLIFIVGTANYYNFMDGINGIAAVTGIVAFGMLGCYGWIRGEDPALVKLCFVMFFACAGFLPFNAPKARVFMGDAGSILLGFVFAGMVVLLAESFLDFVCMAAFLFPFYADELTTLYVRIKDEFHSGRMNSCGIMDGWMNRMPGLMDRLMKPHRRHVYQLLANEIGVAHWKVSVGYGVLQTVVGIGALAMRGYGTLTIIFFLGACFAGFWGFGYLVRKRVEADTFATGIQSTDYADLSASGGSHGLAAKSRKSRKIKTGTGQR